jgi:hypothetical protein
MSGWGHIRAPPFQFLLSLTFPAGAQGHAPNYGVKPGTERGAPADKAGPARQNVERRLQGVFRLVKIAEDAFANAHDPGRVTLEKDGLMSPSLSLLFSLSAGTAAHPGRAPQSRRQRRCGCPYHDLVAPGSRQARFWSFVSRETQRHFCTELGGTGTLAPPIAGLAAIKAQLSKPTGEFSHHCSRFFEIPGGTVTSRQVTEVEIGQFFVLTPG